VEIGEVAAAAAGDEDLAAGLRAVFEQSHASAAPAGSGGAHKARGARSEDNDVELARGGHACRFRIAGDGGALWNL
jgi:hypothetical protein